MEQLNKRHLFIGRYSSGRRGCSPKALAEAHSGSNPDRSANTKIIIIEESPNWDSVKIELDGLNLLIKKQNGHSYYENVAVIPLRVIRMFNE